MGLAWQPESLFHTHSLIIIKKWQFVLDIRNQFNVRYYVTTITCALTKLERNRDIIMFWIILNINLLMKTIVLYIPSGSTCKFTPPEIAFSFLMSMQLNGPIKQPNVKPRCENWLTVQDVDEYPNWIFIDKVINIRPCSRLIQRKTTLKKAVTRDTVSDLIIKFGKNGSVKFEFD